MACLYPTGYRIFPQKPLSDRLLRFAEDCPRLQTVVRSVDNKVIGVCTCTINAGVWSCLLAAGEWDCELPDAGMTRDGCMRWGQTGAPSTD